MFVWVTLLDCFSARARQHEIGSLLDFFLLPCGIYSVLRFFRGSKHQRTSPGTQIQRSFKAENKSAFCLSAVLLRSSFRSSEGTILNFRSSGFPGESVIRKKLIKATGYSTKRTQPSAISATASRADSTKDNTKRTTDASRFVILLALAKI